MKCPKSERKGEKNEMRKEEDVLFDLAKLVKNHRKCDSIWVGIIF